MTSKEDKDKRRISVCENNSLDYIDNDYRRIFPDKEKLLLEDKIFEEHIALCLTNIPLKFEIKNCEFKKGLNIRRGEIDKDYNIYIYKSEINDTFSLVTHDNTNDISIDTCNINDLLLSGKCNKLDIYNTNISIFMVEYLKVDEISFNKTKIKKYKLNNFTHNQVSFDTDKLAISDYSKFITNSGQTKKEVSEIYHRFVLKASKSIKANSDINFQLTKATSFRFAFVFGYFYKPWIVVFWMMVIVLIYGVIYMCVYNLNFINGLFQSGSTFLTIGFLKSNSCYISIWDSLLMLSEGIIGVTYTATLLTSIINSTRKQ